MSARDIRIGLLSDLSSHHSDNALGLFKGVGKNIVPFDHSLSNRGSMYYNIYDTSAPSRWSSYQKRLLRIYSQLFGVKDAPYEKALAEYLSRNRLERILVYWGLNPMADIIWIKKHQPEIKVILNVLCHPLGLTKSRIFMQNLLFRLGARYIDGIVYPSQVMKTYFQQNVLRGGDLPSIVSPPYLSERYFVKERAPSCSMTPNTVFLGRMDWWAGQPTDDVVNQLNSLMDRGIHVYYSDKTNAVTDGEYRHPYRPAPLIEVIKLASQFDASLMVYNLKACQRDDRFRVTIPDRVVASIAARIPIAIPNEGYDACKEFLSDYKAVIEFGSPQELKEQLDRRDYIMELRALALENSERYYAEAHLDPLVRFVTQVGRT
jgi:hypothetical protein